MEYSTIQNKGLNAAIITSSILSLIGSGAIIIATFITKNVFGKGKLWNRIIFILSFWDMCGALAILFRQFNSIINDKFFGLTIHFFYINSIIWTAVIAFNIFFIAVCNKKLREIERYEILIHTAVFGLSLLLTIPLYYLDKNNTSGKPIFGDKIFWSWITKDYSNYRLMFFYCPLWIIFIFNVTVYLSTGPNRR